MSRNTLTRRSALFASLVGFLALLRPAAASKRSRRDTAPTNIIDILNDSPSGSAQFRPMCLALDAVLSNTAVQSEAATNATLAAALSTLNTALNSALLSQPTGTATGAREVNCAIAEPIIISAASLTPPVGP